MKRTDMLKRAQGQAELWDIVVIGGGATGVGVAVDSASRGYSTLLLEQHDFGKGTSSRSTKLVHGGVRYLEQGNVSLVLEALHERGMLRQNAPHIVHELPFVVPSYAWWEGPFYGVGLKLYQALAGKYGFGPSRILSKEETLHRLPNVKTEGLTGGVMYFDGQFDDARLLINMAATAAEQGATVLNYAKVTRLAKDPDGHISGVAWEDVETGQRFDARAKVVINATGPFTDSVRRLADPGATPMIAPSQGTHLVFDRSFLQGDTAIMVPHTSDGRVMFAIPWHGHTLVGTTDIQVDSPTLEPKPMDQEIDFILETAGLYLHKKPAREDIRSMFAGIRPLVSAGHGRNTAALSRDHTIHLDQSGLLTITGGKWTTYRNMAQDCVDHAATLGGLTEKPCVTKSLPIHAHHPNAASFGALAVYGSDAPAIQQLVEKDASLGQPLDAELPYTGAEIIWCARSEMARTAEDALARRTRALFLNAKAAVRMAPLVIKLLAKELGRDRVWQDRQIHNFGIVALGFLGAGASHKRGAI